jgi:hypothetical protein
MRILALSTILFSGVALAAPKFQLHTGKQLTANGPSTIQVDATLEGIEILGKADAMKTVHADGLNSLNIPGKPDLLTTGRLFFVPAGYNAQLVIDQDSSEVVDDVLVKPMQRKYRCSHKDSFMMDRKLYSSEQVYPASPVAIEPVGSVTGGKIMRLAFYPVRADFTNKTVIMSKSLKVRVEFVANGQPTFDSDIARDSLMAHVLKSMVINKAEYKTSKKPATENMLIVVADSLASSIQPFAAWKAASGIGVDVATYTAVGGNRAAMQRYIQNYYDNANKNLAYLLVVGNQTTVQPYMLSTSSGSAASDYPFAKLAGNDDIPDIMYGRIVANNANEVAIQTQKIMEYEKLAATSDSWYPNGTTIASNEGSGPSDEQYVQMMEESMRAHTYTGVDRFYQRDRSATAANISAALANGRSWLTYVGHGSGVSWGSTNDYFGVSTINTLTNANRLPVIVDVACENGGYNKFDPSFGEAWMNRQSNGRSAGAVAYYGASVSTSWDPPAVMAVGAAKKHFEGQLYSVGATVLAGQLHLFAEMGVNTETIDNIEWYNLFGDPSMLMRTATPADSSVGFSSSSEGVTTSVDFNVSDAGGAVVDARIGVISKASSPLLGTGKTDRTGLLKLQFSEGFSLGDSTATMSGYNRVTKQVDLQ